MIPKFRAWGVERYPGLKQPASKMHRNVSVVTTYPEGITFILTNFSMQGDDEYSGSIIDDAILMQSTGLKDYFGEELFEGDVIEWSYWDGFEDSGTAKIIFDKGMFKLLAVSTEKSVWDNLFDCIENCSVFLQGNIYENPELLEDKE
ncbi:YopX family protein [Streptococcus mitis]|uniref:YopX family protein n=1 Tax=Streptococcus mitis TaxID=28037 RepID=UPI001CC1100B|nr:YopX family protein [Streptococcus mitis]MBZ2107708.1 YopX family protein [Streptococcus mitis]